MSRLAISPLAKVLAAGAIFGAALLTSLVASPEARADTWSRRPWAKGSERDLASKRHSPWSFTFETRLGPYFPEIDEESQVTEACGRAYTCFFGKGPQFYFGVELDWLPVRIPYVGKIGPGFGWGVVLMNSRAKKQGATFPDPNGSDADSTSWQSTETTGITLFPMHASLVLRIDEIARRTVIPVVPYGKIGFGFGTFATGTSKKTSKVSGVEGRGTSMGLHTALGGMIGLNGFDQRSGSQLRENVGVSQAYLFGEWMWANLDSGLGKPGMHIGSSTAIFGFALDF